MGNGFETEIYLLFLCMLVFNSGQGTIKERLEDVTKTLTCEKLFSNTFSFFNSAQAEVYDTEQKKNTKNLSKSVYFYF